MADYKKCFYRLKDLQESDEGLWNADDSFIIACEKWNRKEKKYQRVFYGFQNVEEYCEWQRNVKGKYLSNELIRPFNPVKLYFDLDISTSDVNYYDDKNVMAALHWATLLNHLEIASILLENSANINLLDASGCTPLYYACVGEHIEMVKFLVSKNADVNISLTIYNHLTSVLLTAVEADAREIVQILLDNGADINFKGENEGSALISALLDNYDDMAALLLYNNIDVDFTRFSHTALHIAVIKNDAKLIQRLLDKGANIHIRNKDGETALDVSLVLHRNEKIINMLRGALAPKHA